MPAGSLFFPLLSPVALAAVLQFRNPSAKASGTGTSPLFQPVPCSNQSKREVAKSILIFVFLTSKQKKVRKSLEDNRKIPIFASSEH
jgi:hypothetical protein